MLRHPILRALIFTFATSTAALLPIGAAMTFRVVRDLGQPPAAFGLTVTAIGVGTIVGSVFAARLGPGTNVARVMLVAVGVVGLANAVAGVVPSLPAVVALNAVSGAGEVVVLVVYVSVRAGYSPDALLGRIGSTARVMALGLMPIASLIGGSLIDAIGGSATLVVLGGVMCGFALACTRLSGLRAAEFVPATPSPATPLPAMADGLER